MPRVPGLTSRTQESKEIQRRAIQPDRQWCIKLEEANGRNVFEASGRYDWQRYIESLRDGREVWIDGKRVDDVTTHPAFRDMIKALADVYDLQNSDQYRDEMTYVDPESGLRTSLSWLLPKTLEDSAKKRRNSQLWNMLTWGQLGRSPDILAPFVSQHGAAPRAVLASFKNPHCDFGENILNYYRYCRDNDLFLTHALGDPQVDRSTQPQNERRAVPEDEEIALHVVEETAEGVIVSGGKQLSTAAVHSNETYVSLSATFFARNDPRFVLAFSIPTNSKGLKILAREPVGRWFGSWGHPFQMLDEQDCMLFFDRVLVPWDRIFFLYESPARVFAFAGPGGAEINFAGWANLERALFRFRLLTAVATMVAQAIGVFEYREVASKLGEMAANCEMLRLAMDGVEHSIEAHAGHGSDGRLDGANHLAHDRAAARDLRLRHRHAAQRERPRQPGAAAVPVAVHARQRRRRRVQVAVVPLRPRPGDVVVRHAPGHLRVLARRRPEPQPHQPAARLRPE